MVLLLNVFCVLGFCFLLMSLYLFIVVHVERLFLFCFLLIFGLFLGILDFLVFNLLHQVQFFLFLRFNLLLQFRILFLFLFVEHLFHFLINFFLNLFLLLCFFGGSFYWLLAFCLVLFGLLLIFLLCIVLDETCCKVTVRVDILPISRNLDGLHTIIFLNCKGESYKPCKER